MEGMPSPGAVRVLEETGGAGFGRLSMSNRTIEEARDPGCACWPGPSGTRRGVRSS